MDKDIIVALIAAAATVITSFTGARVVSFINHSEKRAVRRAHESRLAMELMYSNCALSLATAEKVLGKQNDDEIEKAMAEAEAARKEYMSFVRDEASRNFSKV